MSLLSTGFGDGRRQSAFSSAAVHRTRPVDAASTLSVVLESLTSTLDQSISGAVRKECAENVDPF